MTDYFTTNTSISSTNGFRLGTKDKIDEYVEENYKPDSPRNDEDVELISQINRNSWQARYNVNLETEEELQELLKLILEIVEDANNEFKNRVEQNIEDNSDHAYECDDVYVFVEAITTDGSDRHDGYTVLGNASSPSDISELTGLDNSQYPLPALDVSVKLRYY